MQQVAASCTKLGVPNIKPRFNPFACIDLLCEDTSTLEALTTIQPDMLSAFKEACEIRLAVETVAQEVAQLGYEAEPWRQNGINLPDPTEAYAKRVTRIEYVLAWIKEQEAQEASAQQPTTKE